MPDVHLQINGDNATIAGDGDMPLLWALRDLMGMTGTKFGCGAGLCGACTVLVDGSVSRSCQLPISILEGAEVTTIEGIAGADVDALRAAWGAHDAVQCGYCQSGQIIAAAALLRDIPDPTDDDIDAAMRGNLCRCGSYQRMRLAIRDAATRLAEG